MHRDGAGWLRAASEAVVAALAGGREATSSELRAEIPLLEGAITYGEGKSWGGNAPIGPRVLTTLSAAGEIVRASNDGGWVTSRPRWAAMTAWLGEPLAPPSEADAMATLVERWLRAFGPGTEADIKWWLGSTVARGAPGARAGSAPSRSISTAGPATCSATTSSPTAPPEPWAALAPAARPHDDGLVRARLVPR